MARAVFSAYSKVPARVGIRFPYDPQINERLKDHGGHWDPAARTWHVPRRELDAISEILGDEFDLDVVDDTGYGQAKPQPKADPAPVDRVAFYEAMFARLSELDAKQKHRDLLRAFHPDHAGDTEEAKAVNAAYDRVRGRNQRRGA